MYPENLFMRRTQALFAVVFSIPTLLAILIVLIGQTILFLGLAVAALRSVAEVRTVGGATAVLFMFMLGAIGGSGMIWICWKKIPLVKLTSVWIRLTWEEHRTLTT